MVKKQGFCFVVAQEIICPNQSCLTGHCFIYRLETGLGWPTCNVSISISNAATYIFSLSLIA